MKFRSSRLNGLAKTKRNHKQTNILPNFGNTYLFPSEIAAINAIHPDTVTSTSSLGADVTGELNSRAESFVSLHVSQMLCIRCHVSCTGSGKT